MIYHFTQKASDHPAQFYRWAERRGSPYVRCFVFDIKPGQSVTLADQATATAAIAAGWITSDVIGSQ